jgi:hypothetical protein
MLRVSGLRNVLHFLKFQNHTKIISVLLSLILCVHQWHVIILRADRLTSNFRVGDLDMRCLGDENTGTIPG